MLSSSPKAGCPISIFTGIPGQRVLLRLTIRECTGTAGIMTLCHLTEAWGGIWDMGRLRGTQALWVFSMHTVY